MFFLSFRICKYITFSSETWTWNWKFVIIYPLCGHIISTHNNCGRCKEKSFPNILHKTITPSRTKIRDTLDNNRNSGGKHTRAAIHCALFWILHAHRANFCGRVDKHNLYTLAMPKCCWATCRRVMRVCTKRGWKTCDFRVYATENQTVAKYSYASYFHFNYYCHASASIKRTSFIVYLCILPSCSAERMKGWRDCLTFASGWIIK